MLEGNWKTKPRESNDMKIQIADINNEVVIYKDFTNINPSLIAHVVCELELIKQELLNMYDESGKSESAK